MTQIPKKRFITRKRLGISLGVITVLVALFGLLGYFWLPGYAKSQLELQLSELLDRPVSVQAIEIKPYTLELAVQGFRIGEKAGGIDAAETFVAFEHLYLDVSSESITQRALVISAVMLDTLYIRLAREDEALFNISDLIDKFTQPSDDEETTALFSISNIILKNGHIEWVDRFKDNHQEISEINFAIPFAANLDKVKANWIEPHFSAQINGALFSLEGKLRPFTDKREASLALKLNDIDLTNVATYVPFPAGIGLLSGYFDSDLTVTFAQSSDDDAAITLTGEAALKEIVVQNKSVQAPYQFDLGYFRVGLDQFDLTGQQPSHLVVRLKDVALSPFMPFSSQANKKDAVLSLAQLEVDDLMVDMSDQQVVLSSVVLDGLNSTINREQGGSINLMRFLEPSDRVFAFFIPKPERKPPQEVYEEWLQLAASQETVLVNMPIPERKPPPAAYEEWRELAAQMDAEQVDDEGAPWIVQVKQFRLNDAAVRYADLTLADVAPMTMDSLDLVVENIDISGAAPLDLQLSARVNQHGSIEANGALAWAPIDVDLNLNVQAVDLVSLQGWAADVLNVLLTSGDITFQGAVEAAGEPLRVAVNGDGKLNNFNLFDQKSAKDLLRWKHLDINGIGFINEPFGLDIDTVKLGQFFAQVILLPDGELNLKQIVRQDEAQQSANDPVEVVAGQQGEEKPLPVRVGKIMLQQGNVDFYDRFVQPNYHANLTGLVGHIGPISSGRSGEIDIKGAIDRSAPLEIQGNIAPLGSVLLLDIVARAKDIDLPPFSPYSGKYVGYAIEKGKLSVDVHYHLEDGALTAENNVFLDQFTLGERVDSEEAVSVPLELAIALLKNRRGEIDIHLPIKGSMDDPQFSLGSIILDAFINLITRAVTAPFALLGSMLGDGEELSEIPFTPGFASLEIEAKSRLQNLSQALIDRPALRLEIIGHVDPVKDHDGLKYAKLQRQIKAQKLSEEAKKGKAGGALTDVSLTSEEYSSYLEVVYKEADFEKPTNFIGLTKSLPDEEMEQLLLAHIEVSDADMKELAHNRAVAAQNWLMENGGISGDRVFVVGSQRAEKAVSSENSKGSYVEFVLK